jgi:hypothetical protein
LKINEQSENCFQLEAGFPVDWLPSARGVKSGGLPRYNVVD